MRILRVEEFTPQDQYPVLRITYDEGTEDLPMIEVSPAEDKPGYWVVNENRLTPFQKELFITACDWCTAEGGSLSATPIERKFEAGEDLSDFFVDELDPITYKPLIK